MRRRIFPFAARVLGVVCALFVIWLLHPRWLPGQMIFYLFVGQAVALYAFIGFQTSVSPMSAVASVSEPEPAQKDDPAREDSPAKE
jgi:hypothetical protein